MEWRHYSCERIKFLQCCSLKENRNCATDPVAGNIQFEWALGSRTYSPPKKDKAKHIVRNSAERQLLNLYSIPELQCKKNIENLLGNCRSFGGNFVKDGRLHFAVSNLIIYCGY